MINYTERVGVLMRDIVSRAPELSLVDLEDVLVFARWGRSDSAGAFATCHCLNLPPSEPAYYFWRDRRTGRVLRRSEWFVTRTPVVRVGSRRINYLISIALPRFCDQRLPSSRKATHYPGAESWLAKLDTIVHELYHIDPRDTGLRRLARADGGDSLHTHSPAFYENVARLVKTYLASRPAEQVIDFLRYDFAELEARFGGVVATTFRNFPSFPQRYVERLDDQPAEPRTRIVPLKITNQPDAYGGSDLEVRQFFLQSTRRLGTTGRAARRGRGTLSRIAARPAAAAARDGRA